MPFIYSTTEQNAAMAAAAAAANGVKRAAYLSSWGTAIGSNADVILYRNSVAVWEAALTGALPVVGPSIIITAATQSAVAAADIDTGTWELRVEKSTDSAVYIGATVAAAAASEWFSLSADLETDSTVSISVTFNAPALDTTGGGSGDGGITLEMLQGDVNVALAHEMVMDGLPTSWSWGEHARAGVGANPPGDAGWGAPAWIAWGHVATEYNNAPGVHNWRVATLEIHSHEKRSGAWAVVHSPADTAATIEGSIYLDYETNAAIAADMRSTNGYDEAKFPNAGGAYHFYPTFRTAIPTSGATHRVALIKASLTLDDPEGTDDRSAARCALLVGGDYWKSMSQGWDPNSYSNDDFWIGRARKPAIWPSTSWHAVHTMTSEADINEYIAWLATQGIG